MQVVTRNELICNLFDIIIKYINYVDHPRKYQISEIYEKSFNFSYIDIDEDISEYKQFINESIINYNKSIIIKMGLNIGVYIGFEHIINCDEVKNKITCYYMLNNKDPLQCPIYFNMKQLYQFNEENLRHINQYSHFENEYDEKPECKYNDKCFSYKRLENGLYNASICDLCHIKLYKHLPPTNIIKLSSNINPLKINYNKFENFPVYKPNNIDKIKWHYTEIDGFLFALIDEVICNGFGSCLSFNNTQNNLIQIVDSKMNCFQHLEIGKPLNRGYILALILYTGCDCTYDLCSTQRNGNYLKWKWFDYNLYFAIQTLSDRETGHFHVFSGLHNVKLNKKQILNGYFATYLSASWNKKIAKRFIKNTGMLIQIDKIFKNNKNVFCCDVSWISKFGDEHEILFARSTSIASSFKCKILDDCNAIQIVQLTNC